MTSLKKKIDGEDDDDDPRPPPGQGRYAPPRRSMDRERYDADPHVISDDLADLNISDDERRCKLVWNVFG